MDISLKRIIAFVIDILIISILFNVIYLLPIDPYKDKYNENYSNYTALVKSAEDTNKDVKDELITLNYDIYKYKTYNTLISASIFVLYFGILEYALKGQTLGKKVMKIKVESTNNKDTTILRYILRIIVLNNIWLALINQGCVYIFSRTHFYYITYVISMLSSIFYMMNIIMVMFRKDNRGLHDFASSTKVVDVNVKTEPEVVKKESIKEKANKKEKKNNK